MLSNCAASFLREASAVSLVPAAGVEAAFPMVTLPSVPRLVPSTLVITKLPSASTVADAIAAVSAALILLPISLWTVVAELCAVMVATLVETAPSGPVIVRVILSVVSSLFKVLSTVAVPSTVASTASSRAELAIALAWEANSVIVEIPSSAALIVWIAWPMLSNRALRSLARFVNDCAA